MEKAPKGPTSRRKPVKGKRRRGTGRVTPMAIAQTRKRARALDLRLQGWSYREIAAELGWSSSKNSYYNVMKALDDTIAEPSAQVRAMELARLDVAMRPFMMRAAEGDADALNSVLKIMDRRTRLLGLDAPNPTALARVASPASMDFDLTQLTDAELDQLESFTRKITRARSP